ncbi:PEP-CTERM sorting domain-containing protein [Duganella sp. BJB488]|nr:PEP-CTERM sorting domain-containing protein [Duganella sp. BJB489]RFP22344.1 PEP-CTERM sorting domain-containing protein [Duganella sp. BJB488]RFP38001.1 PEP-CTERM sorting domain-containing protein [Duganella sp. BJB480]
MKLNKLVAALVLGVGLGALAGSAGAAVLTFDGIAELVMYGNTGELPANMHYDGNNLTYEEAGFLLTLNAPNAASGMAHIGDGTFEPQTYNWHDGLENGAGTYVTLTRVGGGRFSLAGFDYNLDASTLSADGRQIGTLQGAGSWVMAQNGISELRLSSGAYNQLDNIDVSAVPEPETYAMLGAGLGLLAFLRRRKKM